MERDADGWSLRGVAGVNLRVEYEISDARTHAVVIHNRTSLDCRDDRVDPEVHPAPRTQAHPHRLYDELTGVAVCAGIVAAQSTPVGLGLIAQDPTNPAALAVGGLAGTSLLIGGAFTLAASVSRARTDRDSHRYDVAPPGDP